MNKSILLRLLVFITAIIQVVSPAFSNFVDENKATNEDPMLTPADYTFSIWGVITLLSAIYGIYQLLPNRKNAVLHQEIALRISGVYILFSCWLFAADKNWLIITVGVFITMFILLTSIFRTILQHITALENIEKVILMAQVAMYTGWSTVAIFANTASAIKFYGISDMGTQGMIWQGLILIGALANSLYWIKKFKMNPVYVCTILWAFVGVIFGLRNFDNTSVLQILTISAIVLVSVIGFQLNKKIRA